MSTRYKLIRDELIYEYPEERLEICDNLHEIVDFGIKELINLLLNLKSEKFKDLDVIADIIELMFYISEINYITEEQIYEKLNERFEDLGPYSKYLLKIEE